MENISKHISYAEATKSQAAIRHGYDNNPNAEQLENMKLVANKCFEPLREAKGIPIGVSSFFRNTFVNFLVKGAKTSQHPEGKAIDIDGDIFGGITNAEIFYWLRDNVQFDQLIWEYGNDENPAWVHVSYNSGRNRMEVLRIK